MKVENNGVVVFVGSSLTVHNPLFFVHNLVSKFKKIGMLVHAQVQKSLVTSEVKSALDLPCFPITFPHFLIFDYFSRAPENSNVFNSPKRFELW